MQLGFSLIFGRDLFLEDVLGLKDEKDNNLVESFNIK